MMLGKYTAHRTQPLSAGPGRKISSPAIACLSACLSVLAMMPHYAGAQTASTSGPVSLTELAPASSKPVQADNQSLSSVVSEDSSSAEPADNQSPVQLIPQPSQANSLTLAPLPLNPDNLTAEPVTSQPVPSSEQTAEAEQAPQLNRIGRRSVSRVGLATVGLPPSDDQPLALNSMIWASSEADDALFLLENAPLRSSSPTLRALTHMVVTQASVPPKGADQMTEKLVTARLNWLAGSGQSDSLSELTRKLPDDEIWAEWKQWQVDYDLIRRSDDNACSEAIRIAQQSLDPFWQKAKIICHILAGERMQASFAADILSDILRAGGEDDQNFFMLVNRLLGRSETVELDLDNLSPIHLILMDAAHEQISLDVYETLPASMVQASSSFRYLAPNAALKTSFDRYVLGLSSVDETRAYWQAMMSAPVAAEAALADVSLAASEIETGKTDFDGLASAYLWVGLSGRAQPDTDLLITSAMKAEVASGRGLFMLPLYSELVRQRLEAAPELSDEIAGAYAMILALAESGRTLPQSVIAASQTAVSAQMLLNAQLDADIPYTHISTARAETLLPLLSLKGARTSSKNSWISSLNASFEKDSQGVMLRQSLMLNETALRAMEEAAEQGRVGEAVLLASVIIADHDLGWIDSTQMARILASLKQIGLYEEADRLADEVMTSKLLKAYFSSVSEAGS